MSNSAPQIDAPAPELPDAPRSRSSRWRVAALIALMLAALGLRATGIDFLLPHFDEADGGPLVYQLEVFEGRTQLDPTHPFWGFYPQLTSRLASAWPGVLPGPAAGDARTLEEHLGCARA